MALSSSDLIAVGTACLAINAGFLGILLPLHYSIAASLLASLVSPAAAVPSERIRRYCVTADTLVNLGACVWLANVVIGICLLGEYLIGEYSSSLYAGLFSSIGTAGIFGFPSLAWWVVYRSYSEPRRDINGFCVPVGNASNGRKFSAYCLTATGLLVPLGVSVLLLLARVGQPAAYHWRPSDIVRALLLGTLLSTFMILGWILAGYRFRPFGALEELGNHGNSQGGGGG